MDETPIIRYLNTDLDLVSVTSLENLYKELEQESWGWVAPHTDDGRSRARISFSNQAEPELNIIQLLDALDKLSPESQVVLRNCGKFEFNIGYDCGDEPWEFNQGLSNAILKRIADYGATLRWTLYPFRPSPPNTVIGRGDGDPDDGDETVSPGEGTS